MSKDKTQKVSKLTELKREFKKIVWPDKMTLFKQTTAVIVISVILGAIIAIVDFVLKYGVDLLVNFG
ncbi:preprotein translocase subunit SecE [Aequitasia blattaphilus]|uniref:Protein translocase subunit SecE n=1 Tax=Aequitasia blattaphilus TaxID=2949332 RepID=A0ABT1E8A3_9FIRM|nr:preprotein translocase subunit SecE [Aequitasia blattaphilus]MCP1102061.1 preprotein translocase subunit SecE [Aequitasia blattaphilus]MCR8614701.1 preprotein translocase subunit SecE [Aequitasia blattaphilus]